MIGSKEGWPGHLLGLPSARVEGLDEAPGALVEE